MRRAAARIAAPRSTAPPRCRGGAGGKPGGLRDLRDFCSGTRGGLGRHRDRDDLLRQPGERLEEADRILRCRACRRSGPAAAAPRSSRSAMAAATPPAAGLWPPSSQSSEPAGSSFDSVPRAAAAAAPASRPSAGRARRPRRQAAEPARVRRRSPCRHWRSGAGRTAAAAAGRAGRPRPGRPAGRAPRDVEVLAADEDRAPPIRAACRSITASASRLLRPTMPARPASRCRPSRRRSRSSVSPRISAWSSETGVMTVARGCR